MKKKILFFILLSCFGFSGCKGIIAKIQEGLETDSQENPVENLTEPVQEGSQADANLQEEDSTAQNIHLNFKGVPIDGTLSDFTSRMKQKGFRYEGRGNGGNLLQGDFAGFKNCIVHVSTLDGKDLVSKITVKFPDRERWESLHNDYRSLKDLLTEKYGKPSSCTEEFKSHYRDAEDDDSKISALKYDKCAYETIFTLENGTIRLWLDHNRIYDCFVMLSYQDKANSQAVREHIIGDL